MMVRLVKIPVVIALALIASCSEPKIDADPPRPVNNWVYPNDFEPSHVTKDEQGVSWGLFVSQRFSGKNNLWVTFSNGSDWQTPLIVMNAYESDSLDFSVHSGTLSFVFYRMSEDYFYDYRVVPDDTLGFYEPARLSFALKDLTEDRDGDNLPDRIEQELLLSTRLPDSDGDNKTDNLDFCPLGVPVPHDSRLDIYKAVLNKLARLDDPDKLLPHQDTAWTSYFGTYYLDEPNTLYLVLPAEKELPELTGLNAVVIEVRTPLYFGSKDLYRTATGGVIPYLLFQRPMMSVLGGSATMRIEYVTSRYAKDNATVTLNRTEGNKWSIIDIVRDSI